MRLLRAPFRLINRPDGAVPILCAYNIRSEHWKFGDERKVRDYHRNHSLRLSCRARHFFGIERGRGFLQNFRTSAFQDDSPGVGVRR